MGSCSIGTGTYTEHFTLQTSESGADCPAQADYTVTLNGSELLMSGNSMSSMTDASPFGCSTNTNAATCTVSAECDFANDGVTTVISTSLTFNGTSPSGTEMVATTATGVSADCTYDIAVTKD